jgi:hypothetical protein
LASINAAETRKVSWLRRHARKNNSKKRRAAGTIFSPPRLIPQPVIPPAPLTGDAGRGCGDASRAPICFISLIERDYPQPAAGIPGPPRNRGQDGPLEFDPVPQSNQIEFETIEGFIGALSENQIDRIK